MCKSHSRNPLTFDSNFQMEISRRTEHNLNVCQLEVEKPIRFKVETVGTLVLTCNLPEINDCTHCDPVLFPVVLAEPQS